jgi:CRP/FNR family cyclic AMP-dependent transcriptional regulator
MAEEISERLLRVEGNGGPAAERGHELPCMGHLKQMLGCQGSRTVPPEQVIYSQGELPHTVCLICNGQVKLTRTEPDGTHVILGTRGKGWMLGAVSRLLNVPYETTAETITRSRLCYVPAGTFLTAMASDVSFAGWMSVILSKELRGSMLKINDQSALSGRQRLEKFLWAAVQAENDGRREKPVKIRMVLKNWEVAQLLAVTPQHLCRLVRQLEREGVVIRRNGWLILPDPEKVRPPERGPFGYS